MSPAWRAIAMLALPGMVGCTNIPISGDWLIGGPVLTLSVAGGELGVVPLAGTDGAVMQTACGSAIRGGVAVPDTPFDVVIAVRAPRGVAEVALRVEGAAARARDPVAVIETGPQTVVTWRFAPGRAREHLLGVTLRTRDRGRAVRVWAQAIDRLGQTSEIPADTAGAPVGSLETLCASARRLAKRSRLV